MQLSSFLTFVGYYFKRTDKETEKKQFYNDMLVWLSLLIPHGNYKFQSWIKTVNEQEDYPLPTNLLHMMHPAKLLDGSTTNDMGRAMEHISKQEYDRRESNPNRTSPSTGEPYAYTIFSRSLLLTPVAENATDIIEIDWAKAITAQSGNTDTHDLGTEYDEILCWGTLERLYESLELFQEAQIWSAKYKDQRGDPVGNLARLLQRERDLEGNSIGIIKPNNL